MELNKIYNSKCEEFIPTMDDYSIDLVMTSPPYGTARDGERYDSDSYIDRRPQQEYIDWIDSIFKGLETKVKPNGVICWNSSYGADGQDVTNQSTLWLSIASVIQHTEWTVVDHIVWKKNCCFPNSMSPNRLDRICEDIFVFVRKSEVKTFHCNKKLSSIKDSGQKAYKPIKNIIEAANNDGATPGINGATYSTELCLKVFDIYAPNGGVVYDPFMGTGTTAVACVERGLSYIGTEISQDEIDYSNKRIDNYRRTGKVKNSKDLESSIKQVGLSW